MSGDLTAYVDGTVHEPTQNEGPGFDLTVDRVLEIEEPGRVDFGGGELAPAGVSPLDTERRNPDDEYGWWNLASGQYLLEYNETLDVPEPVMLQTRDAVLDRGAFHPTLRVQELPRVPMSVPPAGLRIKENARVSTLLESGP